MPLEPGTTLGPYQIDAPLGAGGMGEVYKATDTRLDRTVAIKVLPEHVANDAHLKRRLKHEAKTISRLNHPHICSLYDIGEQDGTSFLVMEYLEGETLAECLARQGALATDDAVRYGVEIASALDKAHQQGVVHRDLKPGNVMLTDSGAKVLDFGIATRVIDTELETVTQSEVSLPDAGGIAGTLPYMSPEQLRGEPADTRSDIWALGVLLYELAAGERPFKGQTGFDLSSGILRESAPSLPSTVPVELRAVIERCLAKAPGERYQQASEVQAALEAVQAGAVVASWAAWKYLLFRQQKFLAVASAIMVVLATLVGVNVGGVRDRLLGTTGAARIESIAVLPLANLTGDPEQEYFADGIHDSLITDLARLSGLQRVTARTSVVGYKGTDTPVPEIAEALDVDAVVTGSVMRVGDRVQVTAQLIDGATEELLWAERYERELQDVLTLQNEIVAAIAQELEVQLTPGEQERLASVRPVNPAAYEAYLRGRSQLERFTPEAMETALQYFERALEEDPQYALAYAGISEVWGRRVQNNVVSAVEGGPRWKAAAEQAIQLDDTLAEAHSVLAIARTWVDWDWEDAEKEFRRAIEINPSLADAHLFYAHFLTATGRPEEAVSHIERAVALDPLDAFKHAMHGVQLVYSGQDEAALRPLEDAFAMNPNLGFGRDQRWNILARQGRHEEALEGLRNSLAERGNQAAAEALTQGYAEAGYVEAMRRLAEVQAAGSVQAFWVATRYAQAGNLDKVFEWLDRAVEEGGLNMVYLGVEPSFRTSAVRNDPRFRELLTRMNLPG